MEWPQHEQQEQHGQHGQYGQHGQQQQLWPTAAANILGTENRGSNYNYF